MFAGIIATNITKISTRTIVKQEKYKIWNSLFIYASQSIKMCKLSAEDNNLI
jgi:hypothetical protein